MFKGKKSLLVIALIAVLLVVVAGCASGGGNKATSESKKTQNGWEKIKEKGVLTVATSGTLYPTSFYAKGNPEITGYEVEVLKEATKRLGIKVKFEEMGFDGMLSAVNSGQVDAAANNIDTSDDRKEKFAFSDPYKYSFASMVVRKSDQSGIRSLEDLKGKKSAGAATTTYMKIAEKFGAESVVYDNVTNDQYLMDVANGRTDVILNDYYLQKMAIAAFPEIPVEINPGLYYNPSESGLIMKKDNTELKAKIDQEIKGMKKDGTLKKLSEQFFGGADISKKADIKITQVVKVD
ncbi:transporter substrate-binding domain-containing protein [Carnobacterium gallinarum]|uniref:transporter substrate-binding domain-containing protein n=1 Tax=Carnobacterium gallinarum TaxID=2749 RepID=UPI0005552032|nr:transporter substrate-binding domain-containing protein [Carnobacterium gallinarum]